MNHFDYKLYLKDIDTLKTKKAKKEILDKFKYDRTFYGFKIVTYLLSKYPNDLNIGTQTSDSIKVTLKQLLNSNRYGLHELIEFCDTPYSVSEHHFKKLANSRYTTYQMLAHVAKNIKKR